MGTPNADIDVAAARLDPLLGNERLTTEGLTDAIYGQIFGEAHVDEAVFMTVCEVAEIAGSGLTGAVISAAKAAARRGFAGANGLLAGGIAVQANWDRPSVYVELRRGETFLVLRVESNPRKKGCKLAWIHEIQASAKDAIDILCTLSSSWQSLAVQHAMKTSSVRLTDGERQPRRARAAA
jgi:hypothetical protein